MAPLFILTETSAGYALLKSSDKKLHERTDLGSKDAAGICELLRLKKFEKFDSAATALEEVSSIVDGKVSGKLASLLNTLKKEDGKVRLAVADQKLGTAITKLPKLEIDLLSERSSRDIYRAIRTHLSSLIPALLPDDVKTMSLGLSHSLSRHKLKFSPDKIDTMIIQAIALLDDLDKELNMYAMRVKEWYGWHFPEMAKIINDNTAYARVIIKMGLRSNAANTDLADILPEEIETAIKAAAEISMGTDITDEDLDHIRALAEQVVEFNEFRAQLSSYLTSRMQAIAPNLTVLVGELVGARLIAHAGSLMQLAKNPASTIQLLGAEKALFRALKTKHDTPKYGLIYHASLVGQASTKNKGKIARMLGNKVSLGIRIDSLAEWGTAGEGTVEEPTEEEKMAHGLASRAQIERRLRALEGKPLQARSAGVAPTSQLTQPAKFEIKEARKYNPDADGISANAAPQTNGTSSTPKLVQEVEEEDDDEDEDSDEEMADANGTTNGVGGSSKAERKAERARLREEKAKRKAERAAKREAKEKKKKSKKSQDSDDESGKKRKRESMGEAVDGVKGEKKKKKKHSS